MPQPTTGGAIDSANVETMFRGVAQSTRPAPCKAPYSFRRGLTYLPYTPRFCARDSKAPTHTLLFPTAATSMADSDASDVMQLDSVPTLLIVDDDEVFRERLARALRRRGYEVREAFDYDSAMQSAREESPEFAVIDMRMPGKSGLELLRDLKELDSTTRVVMLTGYGSIATAVEAVRLGADNYVSKPAGANDVIAAFERAVRPPLEASEEEYEVPSLARLEWEHINRVLSDCGGNISEAARRLDIHRRSLQRKLQKYPPRR